MIWPLGRQKCGSASGRIEPRAVLAAVKTASRRHKAVAFGQS
jgi:hypothetical protein